MVRNGDTPVAGIGPAGLSVHARRAVRHTMPVDRRETEVGHGVGIQAEPISELVESAASAAPVYPTSAHVTATTVDPPNSKRAQE